MHPATIVLAGYLAAASSTATTSTLDIHITTGAGGPAAHLNADVRGGLTATADFSDAGATANVRIVIGPATVTLEKESGQPVHVDVTGLGMAPRAPAIGAGDERLIAATAPFAAPPSAGFLDSLATFGLAVLRTAASWVQEMVPFLILGLLLILLLPSLGAGVRATAMRRPWERLGIGFVALVAMPSAAVALFVAGIFLGVWWLGVMMLGLYAVALAAGHTFTGMVVGRAIFDRLGWTRLHIFWALLGGLAVISLLTLIPYFGPFVALASVIYGLGALALAPRTPPATSLPPLFLQQLHIPALASRNREGSPALNR